MGPFFQNFQIFRVFPRQTPKKFGKMGVYIYIFRQIPVKVPFSAKMTLKNRYGFRGSSGTPLSNPNLSTPQAYKYKYTFSHHFNVLVLFFELHKFTRN